MLELITAALALGNAIIAHFNLVEQQKYVDDVFNLKNEILAERALGDLADQAKIASLYEQLTISTTAMQQAIVNAILAQK